MGNFFCLWDVSISEFHILPSYICFNIFLSYYLSQRNVRIYRFKFNNKPTLELPHK